MSINEDGMLEIQMRTDEGLREGKIGVEIRGNVPEMLRRSNEED